MCVSVLTSTMELMIDDISMFVPIVRSIPFWSRCGKFEKNGEAVSVFDLTFFFIPCLLRILLSLQFSVLERLSLLVVFFFLLDVYTLQS